MELQIVDPSKIPPLRMIGSKLNLLLELKQVIQNNNITGTSFFDAFSGSGAVGRFFKKSFSIISSDNLYFSYALQRALITLNEYPTFENVPLPSLQGLSLEKRIMSILTYLSSTEEEGFIFSHYTPYSLNVDGIERMYFTIENGKKIDGARITLEEWKLAGYLSEDEYYYLLASIILGVQRIANISGTYGAFNKKWDRRAFKPFRPEFIEIIPSKFIHRAYWGDVIELISRSDFPETDITYLDPPYNSRQYIANYHLLETIARYDNPDIKGVSGIRVYSEKDKSLFSMKTKVRGAFFKLLSLLKTKYVILSYNSEGLLSKDDIFSIFDKVGKFEFKYFREVEYRRFKSHNNVKRNNVKEYIFVYRREVL